MHDYNWYCEYAHTNIGLIGLRGRAFIGVTAEGPWRTSLRQVSFSHKLVLRLVSCLIAKTLNLRVVRCLIHCFILGLRCHTVAIFYMEQESSSPSPVFMYCANTIKWEFHTGGAGGPGRGQGSTGPLGAIGSGPRVEERLDAMESWAGLLLHYRQEVLCGQSW